VLCGRYGKSTVLNGSAPTRIIENAELLKLHQQNLSNTSASLHDRTSSISTPAPRLLVNGYVGLHCMNIYTSVDVIVFSILSELYENYFDCVG